MTKTNLHIAFYLTILTLFFVNESKAELSFADCFTNGMVLQRNQAVCFWGKANPNETVTVNIQAKAYITTADNTGNWKLFSESLQSGGPYVLSLKNQQTEIIFNEIYVGEVWIAGGQSNMELALSRTETGATDIQTAQNTNIRFMMVPRPDLTTADTIIQWKTATSANVGVMSGVAYYFAAKLQPEIGVPVGIVCCYRGGSSAESWVSVPDLAAHPSLHTILDFDPALKDPESNQRKRIPLYEDMLTRIIPFTAKGVIWYQGEANASRGEEYKTLFPFVIERWRSYFEQPGMPFYFVQLPQFNMNGALNQQWAELREAQLHTLKTVPNTGMVVTLDCGDPNALHPKKKRPVGERLAAVALNQSYQKGNPFSGPILDNCHFAGGKAIVGFNYAASGFLPNLASSIIGFELCGADSIFVRANVKTINNNTLTVEAAGVTSPIAIRYAWGNNPEGNLYNADGFMASPFRSDNYPYRKPINHVVTAIAQYQFSNTLNGQTIQNGIALSTPVFSKKVGYALVNDSLIITSNTNFNGSLANSPMQFDISAPTTNRIKISKIEIAYRSVETISMYTSDNSSTALISTLISPREDIHPSCKGASFDLNNKILESGHSLTIMLTARSLQAETVYVIDWIKIHGIVIDPNAPLIEVPQTEQYVGAIPKGKNLESIIDINTQNLIQTPEISISSTAFQAFFDVHDDKRIKLIFTPEKTGIESAWVYIDSDETSASFKIKGWGLPDDAIAAWSFESENNLPDYSDPLHQDVAISYANGAKFGSYYNKGGNWGKMLEVANLCPDPNAAEGGGLDFINLPTGKSLTISFDLQARNSSPNTLKIGSSSGTQWSDINTVKNPLTGLGMTSITQSIALDAANRIRVVAAPDTSVVPTSMKSINPTVALSNDQTTGWSFDNIIIYSLGIINNTEKVISENFGFISNGKLILQNLHQGEIVEMFDITGQTLFRQIVSDGIMEIPLNSRKTVIVRRITNGSVKVRKFM
ncbi:MAG: sialate O-acetylesterase [Paludibacter sp.]|nr:sialate O-acetylesterase [Paludibacter sp.]